MKYETRNNVFECFYECINIISKTQKNNPLERIVKYPIYRRNINLLMDNLLEIIADFNTNHIIDFVNIYNAAKIADLNSNIDFIKVDGEINNFNISIMNNNGIIEISHYYGEIDHEVNILVKQKYIKGIHKKEEFSFSISLNKRVSMKNIDTNRNFKTLNTIYRIYQSIDQYFYILKNNLLEILSNICFKNFLNDISDFYKHRFILKLGLLSTFKKYMEDVKDERKNK